jgi:hypothetical protein
MFPTLILSEALGFEDEKDLPVENSLPPPVGKIKPFGETSMGDTAGCRRRSHRPNCPVQYHHSNRSRHCQVLFGLEVANQRGMTDLNYGQQSPQPGKWNQLQKGKGSVSKEYRPQSLACPKQFEIQWLEPAFPVLASAFFRSGRTG